eukprot:scaffold148548_cov31-Tisochrysis_lutea.AAC.3
MVESLEARGFGVGMPGYDREKWVVWVATKARLMTKQALMHLLAVATARAQALARFAFCPCLPRVHESHEKFCCSG